MLCTINTGVGMHKSVYCAANSTWIRRKHATVLQFCFPGTHWFPQQLRPDVQVLCNCTQFDQFGFWLPIKLGHWWGMIDKILDGCGHYSFELLRSSVLLQPLPHVAPCDERMHPSLINTEFSSDLVSTGCCCEVRSKGGGARYRVILRRRLRQCSV